MHRGRAAVAGPIYRRDHARCVGIEIEAETETMIEKIHVLECVVQHLGTAVTVRLLTGNVQVDGRLHPDL